MDLALDLPAEEALKLLEDLLQREELEAYKHQQVLYYSSLPLYANSEELPEPPEMPEWLAILIEDAD